MSSIEPNKLFVGNLHRQVRRQELKEFFSQWWEVAYASVSLDRETKKSRGFWFVTFINAEDAAKAKEESNEKELHGRPIYVDFARSRDDAPAPETHEEPIEESVDVVETSEEDQEETSEEIVE